MSASFRNDFCVIVKPVFRMVSAVAPMSVCLLASCVASRFMPNEQVVETYEPLTGRVISSTRWQAENVQAEASETLADSDSESGGSQEAISAETGETEIGTGSRGTH